MKPEVSLELDAQLTRTERAALEEHIKRQAKIGNQALKLAVPLLPSISRNLMVPVISKRFLRPSQILTGLPIVEQLQMDARNANGEKLATYADSLVLTIDGQAGWARCVGGVLMGRRFAPVTDDNPDIIRITGDGEPRVSGQLIADRVYELFPSLGGDDANLATLTQP